MGRCLEFIKLYWKTIFVLVYPVILLPIFLLKNDVGLRYCYVFLLMMGFWITVALPIPITSLLPVILFPMMGILDPESVSLCYLKDATMMFVGGHIVASALEHSNLHIRIALNIIKCIGCSPRGLNFGFMAVTMLISMWVDNTTTTEIMLPIIEVTLNELREEHNIELYEDLGDLESISQKSVISSSDYRRPTNTTLCYYLSTSYAAAIGGYGTILGATTNLTLKGIYESRFPEHSSIDFVRWMMVNIPIMLCTLLIAYVWMQFWFMGLFRPNSVDAQNLQKRRITVKTEKKYLNRKVEELGPITFQEVAVITIYILAVLLWIFREPHFIPGWLSLLQYEVSDTSVAFIIALLLFIIPAKPECIYMFQNDESRFPYESSEALLTWKAVEETMPWGLIFLFGGGFALVEGLKKNGLHGIIAKFLYIDLDRIYVLLIACTVAVFFTQIVPSDAATSNILLPIVAEMSVMMKIHPLYLMIPVTLSCSMAFCLPVSSPPNAIVAVYCNVSFLQMLKVGLGMLVISLGCLFGIFPFLGPLIYDFEKLPENA